MTRLNPLMSVLVLFLSGCASNLPNILISTDPKVFSIPSLSMDVTIERISKTVESKLIVDHMTFDQAGRADPYYHDIAPKQGHAYLLLEIKVKNAGKNEINLDYSKLSGLAYSDKDTTVQTLEFCPRFGLEDGKEYYADFGGFSLTVKPNETTNKMLLATIRESKSMITLLYDGQILGTIKFR